MDGWSALGSDHSLVREANPVSVGLHGKVELELRLESMVGISGGREKVFQAKETSKRR